MININKTLKKMIFIMFYLKEVLHVTLTKICVDGSRIEQTILIGHNLLVPPFQVVQGLQLTTQREPELVGYFLLQ